MSVQHFTAGDKIYAGDLVFVVDRPPQESSPFPDIDQMLQDIPLSPHQRAILQMIEFQQFHFDMMDEISRCMGIPERLLHSHG